MESGILTYGGGDTLKHVFDGVSMLMNGQDGQIYRPMMMIGATVGALWAIGKAFWESSIVTLVNHWLIPMVLVVGICMIPTTTVKIYDPLLTPGHAPHGVSDNVPLGLARTAQTISSIGASITTLVEQIFATPDNLQYKKTGKIFAADNFLEMSRYFITDQNFADSLRDFVQNCVVYDMIYGKYTRNDLMTSPDIWTLVKGNTSQMRMFSYCNDEKDESRPSKRCKYMTCREGVVKLDQDLKKHGEFVQKQHLMQHVPELYKEILGYKKSALQIINQQTLMHGIVDGIERKCDTVGTGSHFAVKRAYLQQRNTYDVVGGLASKSIVVLKNVLEALIYVSFIFIMPFAMMPMGFRIIGKWLWLMIWVQLWPPFYGILNSGIWSVAKIQAAHIPGIENGLTLMTSAGLTNLSLDMQTYAAYASLSVPFLSYALLQGGISTLAQIASSVTGVSQSAGASAAQELTTGNYSYGNVQFDTASLFNQTMHQHQLAPSYSEDHIRRHAGDYTEITTSDGKKIRMDHNPQLGVRIESGQTTEASFREDAQKSITSSETHRASYMENMSKGARNVADFAQHMATTDSYSQIISKSDNQTLSEVGQEFIKKSHNWGKQFGFTASQSTQLMTNAGFGIKTPLVEMGFSDQTTRNLSDEAVYKSAHDAIQEESFQKSFSKVRNVMKSETGNIQDEVGQRLTQSASEHFEKSISSYKQFEEQRQNAETYTECASIAQRKSVSVNEDLTPKLVEFLKHQKMPHGGERGYDDAYRIVKYSPQERDVALAQYQQQERIDVFKEREMIKSMKTNQQEQLPQKPIIEPITPPAFVKIESVAISEKREKLQDDYQQTATVVQQKVDRTKQDAKQTIQEHKQPEQGIRDKLKLDKNVLIRQDMAQSLQKNPAIKTKPNGTHKKEDKP